MENIDFISAATDTPVGGLDRDYHLDESGILEHLLDVCQDAALGARLAAEVLAKEVDLATFLQEVAAERDGFATQLALLISRTAHDHPIEPKGTFRGTLFHWRLQLAGAFRDDDERNKIIRIIRQGSDQILKAYEEAEGRPLSTTSRREVHRQAENIRATNARIHQLA